MSRKLGNKWNEPRYDLRQIENIATAAATTFGVDITFQEVQENCCFNVSLHAMHDYMCR